MPELERYSVRPGPDLARKIEHACELTGLTRQQVLTRWIEQASTDALMEPSPEVTSALMLRAMDLLTEVSRRVRRSP